MYQQIGGPSRPNQLAARIGLGKSPFYSPHVGFGGHSSRLTRSSWPVLSPPTLHERAEQKRWTDLLLQIVDGLHRAAVLTFFLLFNAGWAGLLTNAFLLDWKIREGGVWLGLSTSRRELGTRFAGDPGRSKPVGHIA